MEVMIVKTIKRKKWSVLVIPLLALSFLLISPTVGISPEYEVNPSFYTIGVGRGDSRTYMFEEIRFQNHQNGFEEHEFLVTLPFDGVDEFRTVTEGSKITLEVIDYNDTYIEVKETWFVVTGKFHTIHEPDNMLINRSSLNIEFQSKYGPRLIFTTNESLIREVYENNENTNWKLEIQENDFVRLMNESYDQYYSSREEIEYDLNTGFLRGLYIHSGGQDFGMDLELRETEVWDPDMFEVGVAVGDTNTYILKTMTSYDHGQNEYYHEMHIPVLIDGQPQYIQLYEGDGISVSVISTDGDLIELQLTYHQIKDNTKTTDEHLYLIDKSAIWAPRHIGAPLLMTINRTFWEQAPPGDVELTDDAVKFHDEYQSPDGKWSDIMEGSWNLTTGWLQRFYTLNMETLDDGTKITNREWEIIDADLYDVVEPETPDFVGVAEGNSITYEFKEILMPIDSTTEAGTDIVSEDTMIMMFVVDGEEKEIPVQAGDTMTIKVKEVQESVLTLVVTIDSSPLDEEVVTDPFKIDLKNFAEGGYGFIIPADKEMIDNHYKDVTDVEVIYDDSKSVTIKSSYSMDNMDSYNEMTYDLETGWLIEYNQTGMEDGDLVQKLYVIATDIQTSDEPSDTKSTNGNGGPEITPFPLFPVICTMLLVGVALRKKRRNN